MLGGMSYTNCIRTEVLETWSFLPCINSGWLLWDNVQGGEQYHTGCLQSASYSNNYSSSGLPNLVCLHPAIEVILKKLKTPKISLSRLLFSQDGVNGLGAPTFAVYEFQSVIVSRNP